MTADFIRIPPFNPGQELSAFDLNSLQRNLDKLTNYVYSPQSLQLDSWILSPKSIPISLANGVTWVNQQEIFYGSFIYRKGMESVYLGFYISLESTATPDVDNNSDNLLASYNEKLFSVNSTKPLGLSVLLKQNTRNHFAPTISAAYRGSRKFSEGSTDPVFGPQPFEFTFANPYGRDTTEYTATTANTANSVSIGDKFSKLSGDRFQKIVINLQNPQFDFIDGELVTVSVALLANPTDTTNTFYSIFSSGNVNKEQYLSAIKSSNILTNFQENFYLHYATAFAEVDAPIFKDWNEDTYDEVKGPLHPDNLALILEKQQYLITRLENRPRVLTGYFTLFPSYAKADVLFHPWVPDATKNLGNFFTATNVMPYNSEACLAKYAWNPQFELYDQVSFQFAHYLNTTTTTFFTLNFPETYTSLATLRTAINYKAISKATNDSFLTGFFNTYTNLTSSAASNTVYHFVTADQYSTAFAKASNTNGRLFSNKPYQVRIPSPATPVYNKSLAAYENLFFFTNGAFGTHHSVYEDIVPVTFTKTYESPDSSFTVWGLPKGADGYTAQIGSVSEIPNGTLPPTASRTNNTYLVLGGISNIPLSKTSAQLTTYNTKYNTNYHWKWPVAESRPKGYSPVIVNFTDVTTQYILEKASYISFIHCIGLNMQNSQFLALPESTPFVGNTSISYSDLNSYMLSIDNALTALYNNTFVRAPSNIFEPYNPGFFREQLFWGYPQSPINGNTYIQDYIKKFFGFTTIRKADILVVRGKNVSINYGDFVKISKTIGGGGGRAIIATDSTENPFKFSSSIISSDVEATAVVNLSNFAELGYGERYYLTGDYITYAAEFYEEP
jgi:hypothetical protein